MTWCPEADLSEPGFAVWEECCLGLPQEGEGQGGDTCGGALKPANPC